MHILYFLSPANRSISHITVYSHIGRTYTYIIVATIPYCESAGAQQRRAVSHITWRSFVPFRRDGIIIVLYVIIYNIMISYLFKPRNRYLKSINFNPQMKISKLENDSSSNLDSRK